MKDHTSPSERKATKAPAIVAFVVSGFGFAAVVALVVAHSAGVPVPLPLPAIIAAATAINLVACAVWATRKKGK